MWVFVLCTLNLSQHSQHGHSHSHTGLGGSTDSGQISGTAGPDCPLWPVNIMDGDLGHRDDIRGASE